MTQQGAKEPEVHDGGAVRAAHHHTRLPVSVCKRPPSVISGFFLDPEQRLIWSTIFTDRSPFESIPLPIHCIQNLQSTAMEVHHRSGVLVEGFSRNLGIIKKDEILVVSEEHDQLRTDFIESSKERSREMAAEMSRIEAYFSSTRSARSLTH